MEATNSRGQKVALLNSAPSYFARLSLHSRTSSYSTSTSRDESSTTSVPALSHRHPSSSSAAKTTSTLASPALSGVRTPQLVRFDSSSSQTSLQTPSPMTPDYPFEPLEQQKTLTPVVPYYRVDGPYYAPSPQLPVQLAPDPNLVYYDTSLEKSNDLLMQDGIYPALPINNIPIQPQYAQLPLDQSIPVSPQQPAILPAAAIVPIPIPAIATETMSSEAKSPVKKKYPCPHATRFGCYDTFTTSGHAARHGKKHTGEKNIHCPTCNKAFTRKDNMKQHERTHRQESGTTTTPSLRASASSSSSITASEMKEAHSAQRKRQKLARARGPSVPASLVSNEQQSPSMDEMDDDEDDVEEAPTQTSHVQVEPARMAMPSRPQIRRANPTESLGQNHHLRITSPRGWDGRPSFDRTVSGDTQDGEGESPGLDALAMAASGMLS